MHSNLYTVSAVAAAVHSVSCGCSGLQLLCQDHAAPASVHSEESCAVRLWHQCDDQTRWAVGAQLSRDEEDQQKQAVTKYK